MLDFDAKLYKEIVDGSIIGRDSVIDYNNKDAGHSSQTGQNKAFIVNPDPALGAMYGKFMFHKAGRTLSDAMKAKGIHYIIHESSAKQMGLRDFNGYSLKGKNIELDNKNIYNLDPSHIKYNYSVKNTDHMFKVNARIPKQWFSALNSKVLMKPMPNEVINDIFNETIFKAYKGDKFWNTTLKNYMENPTPEAEASIIKNIDKIGVNPLLEAINSDKGSILADAVYTKLLGINKEIVRSTAKEDGVRSEEIHNYEQELNDFNTVTDRLIKESMAISDKSGVSPIYAHKWIRPYRITVMKNYIMSQITKPKIGNSAAARMRPYDLALQEDFDNHNKLLKELNKRDDIFFLDNRYRYMPLETHIVGHEKTTVGNLWDAYKSGKMKNKEMEEVFRAMVVRVPMDSVSGSHALKFMFFTGRDGHGILLHPRSIRALGGADLD